MKDTNAQYEMTVTTVPRASRSHLPELELLLKHKWPNWAVLDYTEIAGVQVDAPPATGCVGARHEGHKHTHPFSKRRISGKRGIRRAHGDEGLDTRTLSPAPQCQHLL